jgi:threonine/homoserine/homoserine lactone efflux protein
VQGVVSDLSNPKIAAFFSSMLPQFAPAGATDFVGLAALGLLFSAMTLLWLTAMRWRPRAWLTLCAGRASAARSTASRASPDRTGREARREER